MPEQSSYPEVSLADLVVPTRPITYGIVQPGPDISPEGIPLIRGKDYSSGKVDASGLYHVKPEIDAPYSRSKVRGGDILFSIVGYVGQSALVPNDLTGANITQTTARISIDDTKADSRYVYQHLSAEHFRPQIKRFEKGSAQPGLNLSDVARLMISLPKPVVQARIAEILSTVDEAIEQTEALIAKAQQVKAGLMHDLFTRGVTPDGQLRPPREEAPQLYKESPLGCIPKEWAVLAVDGLLDRIIDYRGKTPTKTSSGIPLITAKNIRMGYVDPEPREFIATSDYKLWMTRGIPTPSDILFTTEAPLGNVAQVMTTDKVAFAQRVIILRPSIDVCPGFLQYRLMCSDFQNGAMGKASGTTALGIKQSEFRKLLVSFPVEKSEQAAIEHLLTTIDVQLQSELTTIQKLRAEKSGLMNDLLFGHVQVEVSFTEPGHGVVANG